MNKVQKILLTLCALACLSWPGAARAQDAPSAVHVKLSLADGKTVYRVGEQVKLVLEFTADAAGYQVDTVPDGSQPTSDFATVSPEAGVHRWLEERAGGRLYGRDVFAPVSLSNAPVRVEFVLNNTIRFDSPGRYVVTVTTHRVWPASRPQEARRTLALTTNEVVFDVQPMSEAEEEKEVKRISDALDAARGWQAEDKLTRELSYLTGDASAREKVRRFLDSEGRTGNYGANIYNGLFIARDRALVLRLLEAAMRDPKRPVTFGLLGVVTTLRVLQDGGLPRRPTVVVGMLSPEEDPKVTQVRDVYLRELAAGLSSRAGKSQTTTATTLLMSLSKRPQADPATLAEVRRILLQQFDSLDPFDREYLVRVYWEQMRDPALVPSLEKMLDYKGFSSKNVHDSALKRLIELAPDAARPYVVAEIRDPTSLVDLEVLESLSDKTLPEVDDALLEQVRRYAPLRANFDRVYLRQKTALAARYATSAVYADLMQIYRDAESKLPTDSRAALLAYFARHNEQEALPLIGQTLDSLPPGQDFNFLPELTRLYFSDAINDLLVKRLEADEPEAAGTAAYLLSLHGPEGDEQVVERRLERWRKEWGRRASEADANGQGRIERELVLALTRAKNWKLPPERVKELQQSCVTQLCRQNFHTQ
jgi:hypothetical protein